MKLNDFSVACVYLQSYLVARFGLSRCLITIFRFMLGHAYIIVREKPSLAGHESISVLSGQKTIQQKIIQKVLSSVYSLSNDVYIYIYAYHGRDIQKMEPYDQFLFCSVDNGINQNEMKLRRCQTHCQINNKVLIEVDYFHKAPMG